MIVPRGCPRCGTPVAELDFGAVARAYGGVPPTDGQTPGAARVAEVHVALHGSEYTLTLRTHTPARCAAAAKHA